MEEVRHPVSGLEIGSGSSDRTLYLRADERHHRLGIHAGADDDVAYVGWEVADHDALEAVAKVLETRGVRVEPGTPDELADRRVPANFTPGRYVLGRGIAGAGETCLRGLADIAVGTLHVDARAE